VVDPDGRFRPDSDGRSPVRYVDRPMVTLPPDLVLHPLEGKDRTLAEQLKLFHLAAVILDPFTYESSWLLETSAHILRNFAGADCRAAFVLTCDDKGAREYLGPLAEEFMCFADEDRVLVKALALTELPAFVHLAHDLTVVGIAEGWDPETWRPIAENLADVMSWSRPQIPRPGDPVPFEGTPAAS
jgi:hypothetical protein